MVATSMVPLEAKVSNFSVCWMHWALLCLAGLCWPLVVIETFDFNRNSSVLLSYCIRFWETEWRNTIEIGPAIGPQIFDLVHIVFRAFWQSIGDFELIGSSFFSSIQVELLHNMMHPTDLPIDYRQTYRSSGMSNFINVVCSLKRCKNRKGKSH